MNPIRNGNFTSSEIVALAALGRQLMTDEELAEYKKTNPKSTAKYKEGGFSEAGETYIKQCNWERRSGMSIDKEVTARETSWGKLAEVKAFMELGTEYKMCSQQTIQHPTIGYWYGSPDCEKFRNGKSFATVDIKSPYTAQSYFEMVDCIQLKEQDEILVQDLSKDGMKATIDKLRSDYKYGNKYYWQIASNSILLGNDFGELIIYMPYQSELQEIRDMSANMDDKQWQYKWIFDGSDDELPHVKEGYHYKNMYTIPFEIPQSDKDFLTERVKLAGEKLEPFRIPLLLQSAA